MHQLSPFTCRRLSQLPRLSSVWECDRRPLNGLPQKPGDAAAVVEAAHGDCIMWADSMQGVVRGFSVVPPETGNEAIVRTLLQAIEMPQGGVEPARPRKVVVRDREIQFFLRGALQDLDILVEYAPLLPIIDEVFQKLRSPDIPALDLPADFEKTLLQKAALLWKDAPWRSLSEQEILAIELNCWEIDTLYLSILGLAGLEYGLLFYRDLSSLQQFRHKLTHSQDSLDGMKQAFLEQNCLFINFNPIKDVIPLHAPRASAKARQARDQPQPLGAAVDYEFGSLHPLEGLRPELAAEEAASLIVALEALHRFFKKHDISAEDFALKPASSRFKIPNPAPETSPDTPAKITVKVSTLPQVSTAFLAEVLGTADSFLAEPNLSPLIDDSIPEGSLIMLGSHSADKLLPLKENARIYYQHLLHQYEPPSDQTSWPVLTIQTTRPKAQQLVERLRSEGGIRSICFNPGSDPITGQVFRVGILQTEKGHLHVFNEYEIDSPADSRSLKKWTKASAANHRCCGCIIATGASGGQRGKPRLKEIVAFFEMPDKPPEDLGLAPLVMSYLPE
ncbi:MAG: hypothetical protein WBA76_17645 [Phormidesmis sp.]